MVRKIEKIISSTFYNEIFSSVERFIVSNRSQIKVSKCNLYDINFISLDDFEVRRILSTHRMNRKLKSYLQVVAIVEAKGKNQYGKQMYQILDLDKFDGVIMNQVLDHISISEAGQVVVTFFEGTEVDL